MSDDADNLGAFHFVMVECRDPGHSRGKVAKIVSYGRHDVDEEWTCAILQPGLKRWVRKRNRLHRQGLSDQEILAAVGPVPRPVVPRCNLCHRGLPEGFDHHSGDARVLNAIAARGLESISLEELHQLASNRHKG